MLDNHHSCFVDDVWSGQQLSNNCLCCKHVSVFCMRVRQLTKWKTVFFSESKQVLKSLAWHPENTRAEASRDQCSQLWGSIKKQSPQVHAGMAVWLERCISCSGSKVISSRGWASEFDSWNKLLNWRSPAQPTRQPTRSGTPLGSRLM